MKLFNNILKFLRHEKEETPDLFSIKTFHIEEIESYNSALEDIYDRKIDGIIIKNAFDKNLCDKLVSFVKNKKNELEKNHIIEENRGFTYPVAFSKVAAFGLDEKKDYFLSNPEIRKAITDRIGVDVEKKNYLRI